MTVMLYITVAEESKGVLPCCEGYSCRSPKVCPCVKTGAQDIGVDVNSKFYYFVHPLISKQQLRFIRDHGIYGTTVYIIQALQSAILKTKVTNKNSNPSDSEEDIL